MGSSRYVIKKQESGKWNAELVFVAISRYEGDWQSIPHIHPFSELIYIVGGCGCFFLDGRKSPVRPGDLVIVPPNMEHTEKSCSTDPLEYIALGIEGISFENEQGGDMAYIRNYSHDTSILIILRVLLEEAESARTGSEQICQSLSEILLVLIRRIQNLTPVSFAPTRLMKECSLVKRYLDYHFAENITLDALANMAHMNKFYLAHAFLRYTGLSPISYLNARRLENSRELLAGTNHSIAQIASLCGFSSQSYFAQAFKKEMGLTPAQYRKESAMGKQPKAPGSPPGRETKPAKK